MNDLAASVPIGSDGVKIIPFGNGAERVLENKEVGCSIRGISAEVYMIYNILIAIRWGKCLLPVYSITAIITIAAARILVQQLGIMGAALNYVLSCSILFVLFTSILVYVSEVKELDKGYRKLYGIQATIVDELIAKGIDLRMLKF